MRAVLATCSALFLSTLLSLPAQARVWPSHGFYYVQSGTYRDHAFCRLRDDLMVRKDIFSLTATRFSASNTTLLFMSSRREFAYATKISIGIDGKTVIEFKPDSGDVDPKLVSNQFQVVGAAANSSLDNALAKDAAHGKWLTVSTPHFATTVPVSGLEEALKDFNECDLELDQRA